MKRSESFASRSNNSSYYSDSEESRRNKNHIFNNKKKNHKKNGNRNGNRNYRMNMFNNVYNPNAYCNNCGKEGHVHKECPDPVLSVGIIAISFGNRKNDETLKSSDNDKFINNINLSNIELSTKAIKCSNISDMTNFCLHNESIEFLLICRKHSIGYIEFMRGKYNIYNTRSISWLFKQMTSEEVKTIKENDFDTLWNNLWKGTAYKKKYQQEYNKSKDKFMKLKYSDNPSIINLDFYIKNFKKIWDCPEWGFPKGRRNNKESNLDCAIREFEEETGISKDNITILNNIGPLQEDFIGTNNVNYRHIYYVAIVDEKFDVEINSQNPNQCNEIGNIGWFKYHNALYTFRDYHEARKQILTTLFSSLINYVIDEKNYKNYKNYNEKL